MVKLSVSLFCRLQWKHIEFDIIADTKEIALKKIDEEFPINFRTKPYEEKIDSLKIEDEEISDCFILN